jgi:hypothetical protein
MQPDRNPSDEQSPKVQPVPLPNYTPSPTAAPANPTPAVSLAPDKLMQPDAAAYDENVDEEEPLSIDDKTGGEPIHWQAHEYVHHEKSPIWFIIFGAVVFALMAIAIFVIKDISFAILIPVMAAALLVYAYRPPRILDYTLSKHGLHVNDRLYSFNEFKGFRVIHDGEEYSIMLVPTKRFKLGVSVYFPEQAGEAIVDMLGARLPMEDFHLDLIDKIVRKLRL